MPAIVAQCVHGDEYLSSLFMIEPYRPDVATKPHVFQAKAIQLYAKYFMRGPLRFIIHQNDS
jgi:hypothetical protein